MAFPPNLRHLSAALEAHRLGSISRAAKRVHLSQSAITQALSKLEKELDFSLFTRSSSGLFTTEEGEIFLQRAGRALDWLKAIDSILARRGRQFQRLLTTTQLRAITTVVEQGSYTLAANRLGLTQPTVHRAVRDLENLCQQQFFKRSPAGVEPSWQARQVARYASLCFSELEQGLEEIQEFYGQMTGSLRVGSLPLARTHMVPHAVTELLKEFPEANISIIDGPYHEQLHGLLHGKLDLVVGALRTPAPSPDIIQELLFDDPLHLVVRPGHPILKSPSVDAKQLQQLDWIAPRNDTPAREAFNGFFENEGLKPPEHVIECSSLVAIRELLRESDRATLLSERQVELDVSQKLLAIRPQHLAGTSRKIGLTLRKEWQPTRIQARFIELIRLTEIDVNNGD